MLHFGVIFDMDGVLVDSTEAHFRSWHAIGEQIGVPYPRAAFDRTYGMHNRQSIPLWLGRAAGDEEIRRIATEKERLYRLEAEHSLKPIPGVVPLIQALRREGWRLAVGSSGPVANIELALRVMGVEKDFDAIASGDEVAEGKPHPGIFLLAAQKLGLPPARCVVIEDAPPGIEAAKRAGMPVIAVPTSRPVEALRDATWVAQRMDEITVPKVRALFS